MLSSLSTYKSFLICSLLAAYVASAFHMPAMEALHAAAHVVEHLLQPLHDHHFHTHQDHHESEQHPHDHEHPGLAVIDQMLDQDAEEQDHTARQHTHEPKKKHPELLPPARWAGTAEALRTVKPESDLFALLSFIQPIPEPPPREIQLRA